MLAKGNRSQQVTDACHKHGGFYGQYRWSGGRTGAGQHQEPECVEYPELGMEAIWKIEVEDFPAFIRWMTKAMTSSSRSSPLSVRHV